MNLSNVLEDHCAIRITTVTKELNFGNFLRRLALAFAFLYSRHMWHLWNHFSLVPEIIDPVFAKTSPKRSFSMTEYERSGLVFTKTRSINSGTGEMKWVNVLREELFLANNKHLVNCFSLQSDLFIYSMKDCNDWNLKTVKAVGTIASWLTAVSAHPFLHIFSLKCVFHVGMWSNISTHTLLHGPNINKDTKP